MSLRIHTTKRLSLESQEGDLDICVDERGLTLKVIRNTPDAPMSAVANHHLPLSVAAEMRDFLNYALSTSAT